MTLDELRDKHSEWRIQKTGPKLLCIYGPWRVLAGDPDDADKKIMRREEPVHLRENQVTG